MTEEQTVDIEEELSEEQQMEAWEKSLKETDSGHRPS